MQEQDQNVQGAADEQITQAQEVALGGQQDVAGATTEAQAAAGAPDQSEQGEAAESAAEAVVVIADTASMTLLDRMKDKMAGITVRMVTPEDGTANPFAIGDTIYAASAGEEMTVQAQHTHALIDAGWKPVVDGWEDAHAALRKLQDLLATIPEPLRYMTEQELQYIGDLIGEALK